jgi:hypothetical protein
MRFYKFELGDVYNEVTNLFYFNENSNSSPY